MRRQNGIPSCVCAGLMLLLSTSACGESLDTSLSNKACTTQGECLRGYVCSSERVCVRASQAISEAPDGSVADATVADPSRVDSGNIPVGEPVRCSSTASLCSGRCTELMRDPANCGGCGQRCPVIDHGTAACELGQCEPRCDQGWTACGDQCVKLDADPRYCGRCEQSCPAPPLGIATCNGECGIACSPGFTPCGETCVKLDADALNCGACGVTCQADEQCTQGSCVRATCPPGTLDCARSCVDPMTDPRHCGACGQVCAPQPMAAAVCQAGACGSQCSGGYTACGAACVDLQSDRANCGACGMACVAPARATAACQAGSCAIVCDAGFVQCEDECVNASVVQTAREAGLGMLQACAAWSGLRNLAARRFCPDGFGVCDATCVNLLTNPEHCGRCDRVCTGEEICWGASCRTRS
jgi:hypothetical protein